MRNIDKLIDSIIPLPADREHRDGFNNEQLIDGLTASERKEVEIRLLDRLDLVPLDLLVVETLSYMRSMKSKGRLYQLLSDEKEKICKIIIAASIYQIDKDPKLVSIALQNAEALTDKWKLISVFYYLAKFQNEETDNFARRFFDHKDLLISYNAKRFVRP